MQEPLRTLGDRLSSLPDLGKDIFVVLVVILVAIGSFMLGRLSVAEERGGGDVRITASAFPALGSLSTSTDQLPSAPATPVSSSWSTTTAKGMYVGSRSGHTYHLPWCSGAKRIREDNKVWFASKTEAESRGYRPAGNCKGI